MDLIPSSNPGAFHLILAPSPMLGQVMLELANRLAQRGPLRVVDGGNRLDIYGLARRVRRCSADLGGALDRIRVARAFSCRQMAALLEATPGGTPILVFDLLVTFYDQDETLDERRRLLGQCLARLQSLSLSEAVAVGASLSPNHDDELVEMLALATGRVWHFEQGGSVEMQPRLL
jgi:hypothetical protein